MRRPVSLRQGEKLNRLNLQHHRACFASLVTAYNRSRGFARFRAVVFTVGLVWTSGTLHFANIASVGHSRTARLPQSRNVRLPGTCSIRRTNRPKVEEIHGMNIIRAAAYFRNSPEKARKRFGEEGWYVNKVHAPSVMRAPVPRKNLGWDKR